MIRIGNDIVALAATNADRTREPVFYTKILSPAEERLHSDHFPPFLAFADFVWLSWSVKESVYKCLSGGQPNTPFSPLKIPLLEIGPLDDFPFFYGKNGGPDISFPGNSSKTFCGTAEFEGIRFSFRSLVSPAFIASWVIPASGITTSGAADAAIFHDIQWGISQLTDTSPANQSAAVRSLTLERLRRMAPEENWTLQKAAAGFPFLVKNAEPQSIPLSFSHHHDFVFYAFIIR